MKCILKDSTIVHSTSSVWCWNNLGD